MQADGSVVNWVQGLVLGLVQGLTEFLPISSSAHIRITAAIFGWDDPGAAFTAVSQLGTETAVILYFRRDIGRLIHAWLRSIKHRNPMLDDSSKLAWLVIIGSIPISVLGLLFQSQISSQFRDLRLTATTLIVFALVLAWAERRATQRRDVEELTVKHGVLYGLAQALALIPGVSRSGGTISAGLLMGYTRPAATRYAFLLAIPAVFASGLYKLTDIGSDGAVAWGPTILATIIAFVVGLAVITWLMRFISSHDYRAFIVYRIVLGVAIISLVAFGVVDPKAAFVP